VFDIFYESLGAELHDLNCELERIKGEDPDEKEQLKDRISEFEQREAELKERILLISREAKDKNKKQEVVKQFLSALKVEDAAIVEDTIEQHYKKRGALKVIVAFLSGVLLSLVIWLISTYPENAKFYNTILERIIATADKL